MIVRKATMEDIKYILDLANKESSGRKVNIYRLQINSLGILNLIEVENEKI